MKENNPDTISQKYFNCVVTPSYKFEIIYAEHLNGETVEFNHSHPYFEIYYIMEGQLKSSVGSKIHTLYPGDLLFIAPNIKHNTIYEPTIAKEYFAIIFQISEINNKSIPIEFEILRNEIQDKLDLVNRNKCIITRNQFDAFDILERIKEKWKAKTLAIARQ